MKIYSCPDEVPAPTVDYRAKYDRAKEDAAEKKHMANLRQWLIVHGYTGKYTGEIYKQGMADGYALYMFGDGSKSCLIHLPYGDGYHARDVEFVPKKEIIARIERDKAFSVMWKKHAEKQTA
jgi:hypothetical protein